VEEDEVKYRLVARASFAVSIVPLCLARFAGTRWVADRRTLLGASSGVLASALARALAGMGASWDGICGEYIYMVESVSRSCHLRLLWHGASQRP
jgi:hypothetical protein